MIYSKEYSKELFIVRKVDICVNLSCQQDNWRFICTSSLRPVHEGVHVLCDNVHRMCVCVCGQPRPPKQGLSPLCSCHEHQVLPDKSEDPLPWKPKSPPAPFINCRVALWEGGSIKRSREGVRAERRSRPPAVCPAYGNDILRLGVSSVHTSPAAASNFI